MACCIFKESELAIRFYWQPLFKFVSWLHDKISNGHTLLLLYTYKCDKLKDIDFILAWEEDVDLELNKRVSCTHKAYNELGLTKLDV